MNIWALSPDPVECAKWLDDKRVISQMKETAQLLSHALRVNGVDDPNIMREFTSGHKAHPCTIWTMKSRGNFDWLVAHGIALCSVYTRAYFKVSNNLDVIKTCGMYSDIMPEGKLTSFVNCAANLDKGVSFKHIPDVHKAYKLYIQARWAKDTRPVTFLGREKPSWLTS